MPTIDERTIALSEGLDPACWVIASYLLQGPAEEDMLQRATQIAMEQTVGRGSYAQPDFASVVAERGGKLLSLLQIPDHECKPTTIGMDWQRCVARVAFPVENTGYQIPMLLTVVMSDVSTGGVVKLVDLDLPSKFVQAFQGPKFGLPGIRASLGTDRALVCSILKPSPGLSASNAAGILYEHAVGGADIIKDDEVTAYRGEFKVEDRVRECTKAQKSAYELTGQRTLYFVSITDRPDRMLDNAKRALDAGATGLMLTPFSTGISALQMLAEDRDIQVPLFAHPGMLGGLSWSPDFGISSHILTVKLFRLAGADINSFPVPYGKFPHRRQNYIKLFQLTKAPMGNIKPCFSLTGGGLNPCNIPDVIADLGSDIILAAGGSIQLHPMGPAGGIRAMRQAIQATADGIPLVEAAKEHPELGAAWALWGKPAA
jgi:2,3-diketo-5-methylthiopentyl-1-phosphate enolase